MSSNDNEKKNSLSNVGLMEELPDSMLETNMKNFTTTSSNSLTRAAAACFNCVSLVQVLTNKS